MSGSLNRCCLALRQKLSLEFIQDLANLAAQGVVQLLLLSDLLPQSRIGGVQEVVEPLLERPAVFDGEVVQITVRPGENNNHLFLHRPRLVLVLFQNLGQAAPAAELRLRGLVQVLAAKLRKGRELAILGQVQPQRARHLLHRLDLGVASHARDRKPHVDGGTDAGVEEVRFEVDLAVGDGDDVGGNVGRNVPCLGFDDGERRERPAARFVVQFRRALKESRVKIENVSGIGFAPRGPPQEQ